MKNTIAVLATFTIVASAMDIPECQCEYGDFWYVFFFSRSRRTRRRDTIYKKKTGARPEIH